MCGVLKHQRDSYLIAECIILLKLFYHGFYLILSIMIYIRKRMSRIYNLSCFYDIIHGNFEGKLFPCLYTFLYFYFFFTGLKIYIFLIMKGKFSLIQLFMHLLQCVNCFLVILD